MHALLASLPQPPVYLKMPKTAETIFNIGIGIPLVLCVLVAVQRLARKRDPLFAYCLIGGLLAASFEPIVDVLGLVYMKEQGAVHTFTIAGRTMPLYICFVYTWYVGGIGYIAYRLFERGVTRKQLFAIWAVVCGIDIALELPGILVHTYLYYGKQPWSIGGYPLWWGFVNPVMPMAAGAILYKIKPHLSNWAMPFAVIATIPMADGIANGAAAWPMWAALNQTHSSYVWTYLASIVTLGLSLFCVWIISLVAAREPVAETASSVSGHRVRSWRGSRRRTPSGALQA
jgi:hypothetical protein